MNGYVDDNDLSPVRLSAPYGVPYYGNLKDFTLEVSKSGNLALWKTRDKQALSTSYRIGTDPIPIQAFVEGTDYGQGQIDWILKNPAGTEISRDTVKVTVAWDNLTGYRPQTEGPGYGSPFPRTAVPANLAVSPGVGIRRNGDDDNGNQVPDRLETGIQGENDLIEMMVSMIPNSSPGIQYWLKRYNTNLTVWDTATKTGDWFGTAMQRQVPPVASSAWVEWNTMAPSQTGADLSLYIWDATHQRMVPGSMVTVHFYPFTSVVIAFGGQGADPLIPTNGIFVIAQRLYEEGYDVHAYRESNMVAGYNEVVRAVQGRGVTDVAITGYSQGGGATYEMANNLNTNRPQIGNFTIGFTAYIDGVRHTGAGQERRRPPGSVFHANYYQHGVLNPLDPLFDNGLDGGPITGLLPTDWEIDVETQPVGAPWDPAATHYTIDDPSPPNPAPVHADLMTRFRARVNR